MKKIIFTLLSIIIMFSMCACNGEGGDTNADRPITLSIAIKDDPAENSMFSKAEKAFEEKYTDVNLKKIPLGEYSNSIFQWVAAKNMPDLVWTAGDMHQPYSYTSSIETDKTKKIFEDLAPYFEKSKIDLSSLNQKSLETTKLPSTGDSIWFAPRDFNKVVIAYNKDIFDTAKTFDPTIEYPSDDWTWEEFLTLCNKFRVIMNQNLATRNGIGADCYPADISIAWHVVYYPMLKGLGGELFGQDGSYLVDSTKSVEQLEVMHNLVMDRMLIDPTASAKSMFEYKKSPMLAMVRPGLPKLINKRLNIDFVSFPQMPVNNVVGAGCSGFAMSANSKVKDVAWNFIEYMLSEDGQNDFGSAGAGVPVLNSVAEDRDAAWRQYSSTQLNHEAFVAHGDRDMNVNFFDFAPVDKQSDVLAAMDNFFGGLCKDNFDGKNSLANHISSNKTKISDILR